MKLLVVIVNYRTPDLTIDCLTSLASEMSTVPGTRVIVTDNASGADSVLSIQAAIDAHKWDWATLMPLEKNGGFAAGNNAAIAPALKSEHPPQYVYLLNPDTVVLPDALRELVKFMDAHPDEAGIAGGRSVTPDGAVIQSAFRFHTVMSEFEGSIRLGVVSKALKKYIVAPPAVDQPARCDWVAGASMIVRREVFEKIGLLDEKYFMYYEETDFCLRAARAGFACWYVPSSKIIHLIGQSSGIVIGKSVPKRRPRYWFESRHRYFRLHFGFIRTILADFFWTAGFALHSVISALRGKPRTDPPWLLWDFVRYNVKSWGHRL